MSASLVRCLFGGWHAKAKNRPRGGSDNAKVEKLFVTLRKRLRGFSPRHEANEQIAHFIRSVPKAISLKMGSELKDLAVAMSEGISSEQDCNVFITYADGKRQEDAKYGPGTFYAIALQKKLLDHGIISCTELSNEKAFSKFFMRNPRLAHHHHTHDAQELSGGKVLIVLQTKALYHSLQSLRAIYIAQTLKWELFPLRFEATLPETSQQWPQVTVKEDQLENMLMVSEVTSGFGHMNSIPSPPYTVVEQAFVLEDVVTDVSLKLSKAAARIRDVHAAAIDASRNGCSRELRPQMEQKASEQIHQITTSEKDAPVSTPSQTNNACYVAASSESSNDSKPIHSVTRNETGSSSIESNDKNKAAMKIQKLQRGNTARKVASQLGKRTEPDAAQPLLSESPANPKHVNSGNVAYQSSRSQEPAHNTSEASDVCAKKMPRKKCKPQFPQSEDRPPSSPRLISHASPVKPLASPRIKPTGTSNHMKPPSSPRGSGRPHVASPRTTTNHLALGGHGAAHPKAACRTTTSPMYSPRGMDSEGKKDPHCKKIAKPKTVASEPKRTLNA